MKLRQEWREGFPKAKVNGDYPAPKSSKKVSFTPPMTQDKESGLNCLITPPIPLILTIHSASFSLQHRQLAVVSLSMDDYRPLNKPY